MKNIIPLFVSFLFLTTGQIIGQENDRATKSDREAKFDTSMVSSISAKNIGPTIFNGRVADIDVNPNDPTEFFVAYASGGLWYTANNGITFDPLFQNESVMTIGDIAVDWITGTIYLGSGEQNSSRSSYAGNGVYKSIDKGKTWHHIGLDESHHISKVIIHPTNGDIVWVAALGHLYSKNEERGVYKTIDGGKTWAKTLYVNDDTGASDLAIHPHDAKIIYAATWQRSRSAWNFVESGSGSGIYKSIDGGLTWKLMSTPESGFVTGEGTGRIGLDLSVKEGKDYLFAVIDNYNRRPKEVDKDIKKGITKDKLKVMTKDSFLVLKEDDLKKYLDDNGFPEKYTAKEVIKLVKSDKIKVSDIATYNDNANTDLFDTPVFGAEVYVSTDQGISFKKTHDGYLDDVYSSYGYYFGQIRVQPNNPNKVYIYGVPIIRSDDGGKTWKNIDDDNVHSDHHALWLNPNRPGHLINGNDGGVNISYDDGENWFKCTHPEVGQFYYINVDNAEPYNVYVGAQDNGVWMGSNNYKLGTRWQSTGDYPYKMIMGGDGMQVQIDNRDNSTIYTGFQFGNYFKINGKKREYITPKHDLGQSPYRWNWQTPILLSSHNQDILYMGANKLLRSMNQGKDFTEISGDLTNGEKVGDVPFGTLATIDESKLKFGLIYTGSDDGLVHVSKDGGFSWANISKGLPQGYWISRVQASAFDEGTVYASLNGYRNDHFKPYVYKSVDFGQNWIDISAGLPNEPVNVVKEDPIDVDIIYVGTDHGTYVSFDKGMNYMAIAKEVPNVPVHDLVIQKKSKHLLLGTHGRSIYKIDLKNVYELKNKPIESLVLFAVSDMRFNESWGKIRNAFTEPNVPKLNFDVYSKTELEATLEIKNIDGKLVKKMPLKLKKGLASYEIDLNVDKALEVEYVKSIAKSVHVKQNGALKKADDGFYYPIPGKYEVIISKDKLTSKTELNIKTK